MSRRDNTDVRCLRCRMHENLCLCSEIPTLQTRTRLVLLIHRIESRKPTNTGKLACLCLPNSEIVERGYTAQDGRDGTLSWSPDSLPLMVFPHEGAIPLTEVKTQRPITLIVPDGTWRQAFKMKKRMRELADVQCVTLPEGAESQYRLRKETRDGGLATLEAIARAMGILEGREVEDGLLRPFRIMVERTLWARGLIASEDVTGGIPAGALRHELFRPMPRT